MIAAPVPLQATSGSTLDNDHAAAPAGVTLPLWIDSLMEGCDACETGFHFEEGGCFGFAIALHGELEKIQPAVQIGISAGLTHCVVLLGPVAMDHHGIDLAQHLTYAPQESIDAVYAAALEAGHTHDAVDSDVHWAREVIAAAKSICMGRHNGFPLMLNDADDIADYIDTTTPDGIDTEMAREMFSGAQAVLVKIHTGRVKVDAKLADIHIGMPERDALYKTMPSATAPPIVLNDDGFIADGHHRYRAAVARNDPWMLAYQVIDDSVDLDLYRTCRTAHIKFDQSNRR